MTEENTFFKKKKFDESLIDNPGDMFKDVAPKLPKKRLLIRSSQRTLAGIAVSIRPRTIKEVMLITGITQPNNALRMLQSIGAVKADRIGKEILYVAPHLLGKPLDPVAMAYDDWLLGKADWPEALGPSEEI